MGYKTLYDFSQTLEPKIKRNDLRDKAVEIAGKGAVRVVRDELNVEVCRGYFLSAQNKEHRIVQQLGCNVIVMARGMNKCWDRFVFTKELTHLFDTDTQFTNSPEKLETVIAELLGFNHTSEQYFAEIDGVWKALGLLCPEKHRQEAVNQRKAKHIDDYGIALKFRIPQKYIGLLLSEEYEKNIARILEA